MKSHFPIPYLPPGVRCEIGAPGHPWAPPAMPKRGGVGEAIAAIASYLGASAATASAIGAAVNAAIIAASIAYSLNNANTARKEQLRAQFETAQRNGFRNFRQPLSPRRIIYGRTRVGGPIIFAHNRRNFEAHLLIAYAGHECDAIESAWLLDHQLVYNKTPGSSFGAVSGKYRTSLILWEFLGTSGQDIGQQMRTAVDPRPVPGNGAPIDIDDVVAATDDFKGICALYVVTKFFSTLFEGRSPEVSAIIKGRKIYDPRSSTTAWSRNPALAAADYLVNYMGFSWDAIDTATLEASADICDEDVALKDGGTEKRYEANGVIVADQTHQDVLSTFSRTMGGSIRYSSGKWFIEAGAAKVVDEDTPAFTEADVIGAYTISLDRPDRSLPNAVRGNFYDATDWQPTGYPQYEDAAAVAAEGAANWLEVDLPLTTSHTMAQRIARILLRRARQRRTLSLTLDLRGLLARPGSLVTFTAADLGMDATVFEVDGFAFMRDGNRLLTRLDLIEYDAGAYAWDELTDELDLERGEATLDSIRSRGVVEPEWENTDPADIGDIVANHRVVTEYTVTWGNPETADSTLTKVAIAMTAFAETTDGVDLFEYTQALAANVTNGSESRVFNSNIVFPSGHILVQYGIKDGTGIIQAFFANNIIGPEQDIAPHP